jgi:hypothetical protein
LLDDIVKYRYYYYYYCHFNRWPTRQRGCFLPSAAHSCPLRQMTPAILRGVWLCQISYEYCHCQSHAPVSQRLLSPHQSNLQPPPPAGRSNRFGIIPIIPRDHETPNQNTYSKATPPLRHSPNQRSDSHFNRDAPHIAETCQSFTPSRDSSMYYSDSTSTGVQYFKNYVVVRWDEVKHGTVAFRI